MRSPAVAGAQSIRGLTTGLPQEVTDALKAMAKDGIEASESDYEDIALFLDARINNLYASIRALKKMKGNKAQKLIKSFIIKDEIEMAELLEELNKLRARVGLIQYVKQFPLFTMGIATCSLLLPDSDED